MEPLASFGNTKSSFNTNLSRFISLTLTDVNANEIPLRTTDDEPFEIHIPRDPNLILPPMTLQNVTSITNSTSSPHYYLFNSHYVNLKEMSHVSVHFELHPLTANLSYLLIYKFDGLPILNSSIQQIDGWTIFCPFSKQFFCCDHEKLACISFSDLSNEGLFSYFIDNQKTFNHQSIIFGIRELNSTEVMQSCSNSSTIIPPITDERFSFTSDYEIRVYTSACLYLDKNNQWKSDGLRVTNWPRNVH